jgi:uncharacterized membrane protein YeaQ/YmgE (transglycosylase-associated protein family)
MGIIVTAFIVGLITGWLAGLAVGGIDQLRHIVVGILGSFLGEVVVENIGFPIGAPPRSSRRLSSTQPARSF